MREVGAARIKSIERGAGVPEAPAHLLAETIDRLVIEHCDGRVFTLKTLPEMLETQPFPRLIG